MPTSNCKYIQENLKEKKKGEKKKKKQIYGRRWVTYAIAKRNRSALQEKIGASMKQKEVNPKNPFIN
jgi:hypothetical protein